MSLDTKYVPLCRMSKIMNIFNIPSIKSNKYISLRFKNTGVYFESLDITLDYEGLIRASKNGYFMK